MRLYLFTKICLAHPAVPVSIIERKDQVYRVRVQKGLKVLNGQVAFLTPVEVTECCLVAERQFAGQLFPASLESFLTA